MPTNYIVKAKSKQNFSTNKNSKTVIKNAYSSNNSVSGIYVGNTNHSSTPSNKLLLNLNKNNNSLTNK
jgi:hypothetical protein